MLKSTLLLFILLWAGVTPITAQDSASPWYFAFNKDNGSLAAYNLAGQSNTLIKSGVTGLNVTGTRISSNEALLILRVNEAFGLYDATSTTITRLLGEDGILQVPLAYTAGAAVMVNQYAGKPVYASVFRDGALTVLPNRVFGVPSYARFSQDGRYFRYIGSDDDNRIGLWNYDTTTNEQTLSFDFGGDVPSLKADTYGEHWIQRTTLAGKKASYRVIDLNGQLDDLGTFDESVSTGAVQQLGDDLVTFGTACEADCPIELHSADSTITYQGDTDTFRSLPLAHIPDNTLLVLSHDDQFFKVSADAPAQAIGTFTRDQYHVFSSSFLAVSPDGQWLMTVDDWKKPTEHRVQNLITGEIAATYNYSKVPYLDSVDFGDGLIAFKFNDTSYEFLVYNADGTYNFVHQPRSSDIRVYFELLPDQTALYRSANPYTGIFLHDLKAGTETSILEGAWEYITMLELR